MFKLADDVAEKTITTPTEISSNTDKAPEAQNWETKTESHKNY